MIHRLILIFQDVKLIMPTVLILLFTLFIMVNNNHMVKIGVLHHGEDLNSSQLHHGESS